MDMNNIQIENTDSLMTGSQTTRVVDAVSFFRETLCSQIVLIAERSRGDDITPSELAQLSEAISHLIEEGRQVLRT